MQRKKKIGCWIAGVMLTPVVLVLLLMGLFYLPPVQQWAVGKVCAYASEQTGMDIRLARIRIKPPLDLDLQQFAATTPPDTVLAVEHLVVDLDFSGILQGQIGVEALDLQDGVIDTRDLIATVTVKGQIGRFHLKADDVSLKKQTAKLTAARLDGCDVDIALRDTTVTDTTESAPIPWRLSLGDIEAHRTRIAFHTVGDSLCVRGGVRDLAVKGGDVNLAEGVYKVAHLRLEADSLHYDMPYAPHAEGFDYNHIAVRPVRLEVENLYFRQEGTELSLHVKQCSARDQSGLEISSLTGHVALDANHLEVPDLSLVTPHSQAEAKARLDWTALTPKERGHMDIALNATIGRPDVLTIGGQYMDKELHTMIPEDPIALSLQATGNVDSIQVSQCHLLLSPMVEAKATGYVTNVLDTERLGVDLDWDVQTFDLSLVKRMAGLGNDIRLPRMKLTGGTRLDGSRLTADLRMAQNRGTATLRGTYDLKSETYDAHLRVRNLDLHDFLPKDSLFGLTAQADVSGRGLDLFSPKARAKGHVVVDHLAYRRPALPADSLGPLLCELSDIRLTAEVQDAKGHVTLYSNNDVLRVDACADLVFEQRQQTATGHDGRGRTSRPKVSLVPHLTADFSLGLSRIDLYTLGLTSRPLALSMLLQVDGNTNLSDTHELRGHIQAVELDGTKGRFYPSDIDLTLLMSPDTIFADIVSGDFGLQTASRDGIDRVGDKASRFYSELKRQLAIHQIDQDTLKTLLPNLTMHLKSGNQNTAAKIIENMGYTFNRLQLDVDCDSIAGLNGKGYVYALNTGAVLLDTLQVHIDQDTTDVVRMGARVRNGPKNKQVVFESFVNAELTPTGANAAVQFFDAKGRKGVDLGAQLFLEDDGYRLRFHPLNPILAYRSFTLNHDNFILLHDDRHVEANVNLLADDGTGFQLYSTPNEEALQDITLSVHDFNLGELSAVLPYMPSVGGLLGGDFHLVQDEQSMSVLVDANVQGLSYEGARLGHVGLNAVYLPNSDGSHHVDGIVSHEGNEVMTLAGTYHPAPKPDAHNAPEGEGTIDAQAHLQRLPLSLANGFIPDQTIALAGYATGDMDVKGSVSNPVLDGQLMTDSMYLNSDMYSLHLRFPDDTIGIKQSNLDFNRIEAYSIGRNPLVLDGTINFRDLSRIALNLSLSARDFELINAPKSQRAIAYGKVYVNLGARLTGTLNDILLRGKLDVLGNTDVTYVLTDSPLTVEDQLEELVTFVDFSDSLEVDTETKVSPQNIDVQMSVGIEQAAQIHCLLSADGTNYVDLEGGGELIMTYTTQEGTRLQGRYTIINGVMNYSLMVVALKNLAIQNGSYVEFTGDLTNPRLSISASERVKTTVYENNVPRSVNFDVGLSVSQTLNDMGLEFTIEAPSDLAISNQLATMSLEERGKVAVTMLATGMYLTESGNGTSGFSATNALNSFLQTQISNISNKALSTIDINFGIDNTSTASGSTQTDYSFSFAKRFWGNRISLIIGGKVSSGKEAQNTGESIINNVSIEYRLDKSASRYVRVYYDRNSESLLEGNITEMGAGIVFRKKSTRLGELFLFRKSKPTPSRNQGE
ncbi:MAG: translocation/assembly module TamB domain-containing protein [Bacteroidaceae bacterium]|nr:translocation/assembly module TamB domain-containing protein [Bacteroidaceae bacterium]